ncbi:hypothetical protein V6N13_004391 [Hibiscus sabdariffa]|uniref:Uncharacterized protein n=2 Tax=Hibiscus sabdariffa TaxID=183260 RepID=A0ABR2RYC7_9ROSI
MVPIGLDNVSLSQSGTGSGQQKRLWVKDRSKDWWDKCNHPYFLDEEFRRAFRMSKATFNMVSEELKPAVIKKNMMLHDAISVRQCAAVCNTITLKGHMDGMMMVYMDGCFYF